MLDLEPQIAYKIYRSIKNINSLCTNPFNSKTFHEKVEIWKEEYDKINNLRIALKLNANYSKLSNEVYKIGLGLTNLFSDIFIFDFAPLKDIILNELDINKVRLIKEEKLDPIFNILQNIKTDFEIEINLEKHPELSTHAWGINNDLGKLIGFVNYKLKEFETKKKSEELLSEQNKIINKSEQAFFLGFYVLNSMNLSSFPKTNIFKNDNDFQAAYFPDYQPLDENGYKIAKKLFETAFRIDPNNTNAKVFEILAYIKENIPFERSKAWHFYLKINELKEIVQNYPNNGYYKIELAYAYSCLHKLDESKQLIDLALMQAPNSVYVKYRASTILNSNNIESDLAKILLDDAIKIDKYNNPHLYFERASISYKEGKLESAYDDIVKSIEVNFSPLLKCVALRKSIITKIINNNGNNDSTSVSLKAKLDDYDYVFDDFILRQDLINDNYELIEFKHLKLNEVSKIVNVELKHGNNAQQHSFNKIIFLDFIYIHRVQNEAAKNFLKRLIIPEILTDGAFNIIKGNLILSGLNINEFFQNMG